MNNIEVKIKKILPIIPTVLIVLLFLVFTFTHIHRSYNMPKCKKKCNPIDVYYCGYDYVICNDFRNLGEEK